MSTYRKDRNNIIITLDEASGDYRLDINTGIFYGVKGTPIKTCPRKKEVADLFPRWEKAGSNLGYVVGRMIDSSNQTATYVGLANVMQAADKIDALGIDNLHLSNEQYLYLANNIKWLQTWRKEHENEPFCLYDFRTWCDFEKSATNLALSLICLPQKCTTNCSDTVMITPLKNLAYVPTTLAEVSIGNITTTMWQILFVTS